MAAYRPHVQPPKILTPFAPATVVYRRILKACKRHPDAFVGDHFERRYKGKFRELQKMEDDEMAETYLKKARMQLNKLNKAIRGDPDSFYWTLERAYGLKGPKAYDLMEPLTSPNVLPRPPNPTSLPHHPTPTYSPLLTSLLTSPHPQTTSKVSANPSSPYALAFPNILPPQAKPTDPSLLVDDWLPPAREARLRWQAWEADLKRLRKVLAVRVIWGQEEEGSSTEGDGRGERQGSVEERRTERLRGLGIDWKAFEGGEREKLLDCLERGAGKGRIAPRNLESRRRPIEELDLDRLPVPPIPNKPSSSSSPFLSSISPPSEPWLSPNPLSSPYYPGPPAILPPNPSALYRKLLSEFVILVLDLRPPLPSSKDPEGKRDDWDWVFPHSSPWATGGAELTVRPSTRDEEGLLSPSPTREETKTKKDGEGQEEENSASVEEGSAREAFRKLPGWQQKVLRETGQAPKVEEHASTEAERLVAWGRMIEQKRTELEGRKKERSAERERKASMTRNVAG